MMEEEEKIDKEVGAWKDEELVANNRRQKT